MENPHRPRSTRARLWDMTVPHLKYPGDSVTLKDVRDLDNDEIPIRTIQAHLAAVIPDTIHYATRKTKHGDLEVWRF